MRFNISGEDLPGDMESTDEVMAAEGVWVSGDEAINMFDSATDNTVNQPSNLVAGTPS